MEYWMPFLAIPWLLAVIGASILYRRKAGKAIIPRLPADAVFTERGCSGRSLANIITRLGGAHNCLLVAVTADRLIVTPFFPFNLMFLPEIYGLDYSIPGAAIREVDVRRGLLGRRVIISYQVPDIREVELRMRKLDRFVAALEVLRRGPPRSSGR
jgi:hypothetical protein